MNRHALVKPLTPPAKRRPSFSISDVNTSKQHAVAPHENEEEDCLHLMPLKSCVSQGGHPSPVASLYRSHARSSSSRDDFLI